MFTLDDLERLIGRICLQDGTPVGRRFMDKVKTGEVSAHLPESGPCLLWTGSTSEGYSEFRGGPVRERGHLQRVKGHVFAYTHVVGPVMDGHELDHRCHQWQACAGGRECPHRACVNPAHLEQVTEYVNRVLRSGSPLAAKARQTHCWRGHDLSDPDVVYRPPSRPRDRHCKPCQSIRAAEWAAKRRALVARSREQRERDSGQLTLTVNAVA